MESHLTFAVLRREVPLLFEYSLWPWSFIWPRALVLRRWLFGTFGLAGGVPARYGLRCSIVEAFKRTIQLVILFLLPLVHVSIRLQSLFTYVLIVTQLH